MKGSEMAEAIESLLPPIDQANALGFAKSGHIMVEAMRLAKLAVKDHIRAEGLRLKDYEAAEITKLAEIWLGEHRTELIGYATLTLLLSPIGKRASENATCKSAFHGALRGAAASED